MIPSCIIGQQLVAAAKIDLLIAILSQLPTASLLPLVGVSHRFYAATLRILKQRLHDALTRPDQRLMLECYHPAEKLTTPYLFCNYLRTDSFAGMEAAAEGHPPPPEEVGAGLRGIYSHFRPVEHDGSQGQQPRSRRARPPVRPSAPGTLAERPAVDVYLDGDESFAQLCATTNLVRLSARPGLFRGHVNVGDGVVRVWREWLVEQAQAQAQGQTPEAKGEVGVLWADAARDVGLRFRVAEQDVRDQHPVLVGSGETLPAAYRLEFDELLVRSSALLVGAEKAAAQAAQAGAAVSATAADAEGKAIVLASF
ncbi:hypothetical protein C8A05DRAFT_41431 [Staphylotrichum tortipilum]|uniref:F-box domain-containing protein n=1 Tax=Staphylotrichum tortipilum TaxID=2831512 RepID=A0AAN6RWK4_9PEZI|nr:hypothetical protein C8A05DRAFT_41431 [Staphylotrichum longicolle]